MTLAIVERLRAEGWKPGVASRGYGRSDDSKPLWVEANTPPARGGDEPVLIARQSDARVRVDRDRVAAVRALAAEGCDIVVCDDGLQHYALARDIEIEVIDGRRRHGNGRPIPAGPMREPASRSGQCDFRVLNAGSDPDISAGFGEWPMWLAPGDAVPLTGGRTRPLASFAGQRVHAVAGIGDPERFFSMLRALDIAVVPHAFADHHAYVEEDLRFGSDLPVLMTPCAVKCGAFATHPLPTRAVRAELRSVWGRCCTGHDRRAPDAPMASAAFVAASRPHDARLLPGTRCGCSAASPRFFCTSPCPPAAAPATLGWPPMNVTRARLARGRPRLNDPPVHPPPNAFRSSASR